MRRAHLQGQVSCGSGSGSDRGGGGGGGGGDSVSSNSNRTEEDWGRMRHEHVCARIAQALPFRAGVYYIRDGTAGTGTVNAAASASTPSSALLPAPAPAPASGLVPCFFLLDELGGRIQLTRRAAEAGGAPQHVSNSTDATADAGTDATTGDVGTGSGRITASASETDTPANIHLVPFVHIPTGLAYSLAWPKETEKEKDKEKMKSTTTTGETSACGSSMGAGDEGTTCKDNRDVDGYVATGIIQAGEALCADMEEALGWKKAEGDSDSSSREAGVFGLVQTQE